MRLTTAEIDRYGPLYDCRPPCQDGITVVSGPNEAGKTLYLEALLQLLEPDVADVMDPAPRVSQTPTGRVVIEHGGDQFECDGDTSLCEVSAIDPSHLQSVFVVRDSDLQLPGEQEYYTSLIEKLGDIHTSEINAIKAGLKERGRLTDRRLNISSDQSYNNAGDVHDNAQALAAEIREYIERIEADDLDELEARRLRVKRRLQDAREQLQTQQQAETVADHEYLSGQLETYRSTSEQLSELEEFDRETLDRLRKLRNDLERNRDQLEELNTEINETEDEVEQANDTLQGLQEQASELEQREAAVEDARSALDTYRDRQDDTAGVERRLRLTRATAIAGLLAAGGAGLAGALTGSAPAIGLGVLLLLVAVGSGIIHYRSNKRLATAETAREAVLQAARDAGFDVDTVEEVAPAIESFNTELSSIRERVAKAEEAHQNAQGTLDDLRDEKTELEDKIADQKEELDGELSAAGVDTVEEFVDRVETREDLEPDRQTAKQSLMDRFGDPDADGPESKAAVWEQHLADLVADIDLDAVDPDTYDEAELERLETKVTELDADLTNLQEQLDDHDERLDAFDQRARELNTQPFIGHTLGLDSRSRDGLETLATDLDIVVERIEEDAELSRKALEVFEEIEAREEQKLTDLFDPEGPASRTFEQLTGGRYTEVAYDADTHDLVVERHDGRTFMPDVLSQGTRDQLYFATRVSLAQQLLGTDPGFLLLDDPFLAADPDRLRQGFETLQELADDGWQILYFTAKQEVSDTLVNEYDLDHTEMEPVSLGT